MAEILTDSEIADIEARTKQAPEGRWRTQSERDASRLVTSHRALAAEKDAAYKTSTEIVETAVKTQDELGRRIRTLELACEAARKLFVGLLPELDRAEDVEAMIKRLEGATKNG